MPRHAAGGSRLKLECRLIAKRLERVSRHLRDRGPGRRARKRCESWETGIAQPRDLNAAHVGNLYQAIFGFPACRANATETAKRAMFHRIWLGLRWRGDRCFEPYAHASVIRGEVVVAERPLRAHA